MFRIKNSLFILLMVLTLSSLMIVGCGDAEEPISTDPGKSEQDPDLDRRPQKRRRLGRYWI